MCSFTCHRRYNNNFLAIVFTGALVQYFEKMNHVTQSYIDFVWYFWCVKRFFKWHFTYRLQNVTVYVIWMSSVNSWPVCNRMYTILFDILIFNFLKFFSLWDWYINNEWDMYYYIQDQYFIIKFYFLWYLL